MRMFPHYLRSPADYPNKGLATRNYDVSLLSTWAKHLTNSVVSRSLRSHVNPMTSPQCFILAKSLTVRRCRPLIGIYAKSILTCKKMHFVINCKHMNYPDPCEIIWNNKYIMCLGFVFFCQKYPQIRNPCSICHNLFWSLRRALFCFCFIRKSEIAFAYITRFTSLNRRQSQSYALLCTSDIFLKDMGKINGTYPFPETPARKSKYIRDIVKDGITHPFPHFNGATVQRNTR